MYQVKTIIILKKFNEQEFPMWHPTQQHCIIDSFYQNIKFSSVSRPNRFNFIINFDKDIGVSMTGTYPTVQRACYFLSKIAYVVDIALILRVLKFGCLYYLQMPESPLFSW